MTGGEADELECAVDVGGFGEGDEQGFVGVIAGFGDDEEFAGCVGRDGGPFDGQLDATGGAIGDDAGQEEEVVGVGVFPEELLMGTEDGGLVGCVRAGEGSVGGLGLGDDGKDGDGQEQAQASDGLCPQRRCDAVEEETDQPCWDGMGQGEVTWAGRPDRGG